LAHPQREIKLQLTGWDKYWTIEDGDASSESSWEAGGKPMDTVIDVVKKCDIAKNDEAVILNTTLLQTK